MIKTCNFCKKKIEVKKIFGKDSFGKKTYWYIGGKHDCPEGKIAADMNNYLGRNI